MSEKWTEEAVYDKEIAPLMTKIIEICKKHKIPMVAQFQYEDSEENGPGFVTTAMTYEGRACREIQDLANICKPKRPVVLAETHVTNPDGTKTISIRRMS